jgi:hypothetical protein
MESGGAAAETGNPVSSGLLLKPPFEQILIGAALDEAVRGRQLREYQALWSAGRVNIYLPCRLSHADSRVLRHTPPEPPSGGIAHKMPPYPWFIEGNRYYKD